MKQPAMTAEQFSSIRKGRPRFNRSKPEDRTVDGHVFASKLEAERYRLLKVRQDAREITHLCLQPVFLLAGVKYTADFMYLERMPFDVLRPVVEEIKPLMKSKRFRKEMLRRFSRNKAQMIVLHGIDVTLVEC